MVGNCWISSLQGSRGGKGGDVSGMMWTEEERKEGENQPGWMSVEDGKNVGGAMGE